MLTNVIDVLKASSHNAENFGAVNELSKRITAVKTQLDSWRKQLSEAGALETFYPVEEANVLEEVPNEPRSPRNRPKTWPEHGNLEIQIREETKKFEDWLKTTEQNLKIFIGIAIPQTLNEMKSKLKEVQVCNFICDE